MPTFHAPPILPVLSGVLLAGALLVAAAGCSRSDPAPPEGPTGKTATIVVHVPGDAAPSGGLMLVTATKDGLPDLRLEVPVARGANRVGVVGAIHALLPAPWQRASYRKRDAVVIPAIETIHVDAGETGIDLRLTVAPSPPPGYERD